MMINVLITLKKNSLFVLENSKSPSVNSNGNKPTQLTNTNSRVTLNKNIPKFSK
jgi:hypothetical protein